MEVTARMSVLYNDGNRNKHHVELAFPSSHNVTFPTGVKLRITFEAVDQLGGPDRIVRLLPRGVQLANEGWRQLPFLRVRGVTPKGKTDLTTFLLSSREAAFVGSEFDLPAEVMAKTYFRFVRPKMTNPVHLAPAWNELLAPRWESALRNWVREPAQYPIPWPDSFPWASQKCHGLFLPGVDELVSYPSAHIKGELRYVLVDGAPQAVFVRRTKSEIIEASYPLAWDGEDIIASLLEVK